MSERSSNLGVRTREMGYKDSDNLLPVCAQTTSRLNTPDIPIIPRFEPKMQLNLSLALSALSAVAVTMASPIHVRRQLEECESGVDSRAAPGILGSTYPGTHSLTE
jgi:hypothetical protein